MRKNAAGIRRQPALLHVFEQNLLSCQYRKAHALATDWEDHSKDGLARRGSCHRTEIVIEIKENANRC